MVRELVTLEGNLKYAQLNQTRELTPQTLKLRVTGTEREEERAASKGWMDEGREGWMEGGDRQGYRSRGERCELFGERQNVISLVACLPLRPEATEVSCTTCQGLRGTTCVRVRKKVGGKIDRQIDRYIESLSIWCPRGDERGQLIQVWHVLLQR